MQMDIRVVKGIVMTTIQIGTWDVDGDNYSTCAGDCRDDDASITPRTDNDGDGFVYCDDCDDNDALTYVGNAYLDSTTVCRMQMKMVMVQT